jgi:hypothetical protein
MRGRNTSVQCELRRGDWQRLEVDFMGGKGGRARVLVSLDEHFKGEVCLDCFELQDMHQVRSTT